MTFPKRPPLFGGSRVAVRLKVAEPFFSQAGAVSLPKNSAPAFLCLERRPLDKVSGPRLRTTAWASYGPRNQ